MNFIPFLIQIVFEATQTLFLIIDIKSFYWHLNNYFCTGENARRTLNTWIYIAARHAENAAQGETVKIKIKVYWFDNFPKYTLILFQILFSFWQYCRPKNVKETTFIIHCYRFLVCLQILKKIFIFFLFRLFNMGKEGIL